MSHELAPLGLQGASLHPTHRSAGEWEGVIFWIILNELEP